jgi:hypothetical protein
MPFRDDLILRAPLPPTPLPRAERLYEFVTLGPLITIASRVGPASVRAGDTLDVDGVNWRVDRIEPSTAERPLPRLICLDPSLDC